MLKEPKKLSSDIEEVETLIETLKDYVERGNMIVSGANNLFTFAANVSNLIHRASEKQHSSLAELFWADCRQRTVPFQTRIERKRQNLCDVQNYISESMCKNSDNVLNLAVNPDRLLQFEPISFAVSSAISIVDGYLTRKALRKGFEHVVDTLDQGFSRVENKLESGFAGLVESLDTGFKQIDSKFSWGFGEILWRMDQQSEVNQQIRDLLLRPLDIQSRELRDRGIRSYNFGWFDEALKDLHEAMDKSRVDYVVAQYIGNIYLYKKQYVKSIEYYGLAARYSEPYQNKAANYVMALMYQGLAYYLSDSGDHVNNCRCAVKCLKEAIKSSPDNLELYYQLAQYAVAGGDRESALDSLNYVVRQDPKYVLKILSEPDFSSIQQDIEQLLINFQQEIKVAFNSLFSSCLDTLYPVIEFFNETPPEESAVQEWRSNYSSSHLLEESSLKKWLSDHRLFDALENWLYLRYRNYITVWKAFPVAYSVGGWYFVNCEHRKQYEAAREKINECLKALTSITEVYSSGDIISMKLALTILADFILPQFIWKEGKVSVTAFFSWYDWGWEWGIARSGIACEVETLYSPLGFFGIGDDLL